MYIVSTKYESKIYLPTLIKKYVRTNVISLQNETHFSYESKPKMQKGGHPNINMPWLAPGIGWWCKGGTRLWVAVAQGAAEKAQSLTLLEVTKRQQKQLGGMAICRREQIRGMRCEPGLADENADEKKMELVYPPSDSFIL